MLILFTILSIFLIARRYAYIFLFHFSEGIYDLNCIFLNINSKINTYIYRSYDCSLNFFQLHFCSYRIYDNLNFLLSPAILAHCILLRVPVINKNYNILYRNSHKFLLISHFHSLILLEFLVCNLFARRLSAHLILSLC